MDKAIGEDERWLSTQSPAPNLEIFRIHFPSHPAFSTTDDTLFSNMAPFIHTLITRSINFELSGRWLSHVRHLDLSDCSVSQTILFALAEMMALENLDMRDVDITDIGIEDHFWPTIILPKLKQISLVVKLRTLIVLMGHVAPTPGCIFDYESINNSIPNPSIEDISLLRRGFSSHFQSFSDFKCNATISWTMTKDLLVLKNVLDEGSDNPEFSLNIENHLGSEWHGIPDIILDSLYSCDLSSIETLELDISDATLDPFNLHVTRFYRSLSSLATLHTDSQVMELLLQTQEHLDGVLFPRLQTIVFDTDAELKSDVIMRFLLWRRDAGVPITDFDLYKCTSPNQERLLFLEGIYDLGVTWNGEIRDRM